MRVKVTYINKFIDIIRINRNRAVAVYYNSNLHILYPEYSLSKYRECTECEFPKLFKFESCKPIVNIGADFEIMYACNLIHLPRDNWNYKIKCNSNSLFIISKLRISISNENIY